MTTPANVAAIQDFTAYGLAGVKYESVRSITGYAIITPHPIAALPDIGAYVAIATYRKAALQNMVAYVIFKYGEFFKNIGAIASLGPISASVRQLSAIALIGPPRQAMQSMTAIALKGPRQGAVQSMVAYVILDSSLAPPPPRMGAVCATWG